MTSYISGAASWAFTRAPFAGWARWVASQTLRSLEPVPRHLAIIMDGNRRYARSHGQKVEKGHAEGGARLKDALEWAWELGVECVTVFAFSIENFKRSKEEVEALMRLAHDYLLKHVPELSKRARIVFSGELSLLPIELQSVMIEAQRCSAHVTGATLNICFAYTSTHELTHSITRLACALADERLSEEDVTGYLFEQCLTSRNLANPTPSPSFPTPTTPTAFTKEPLEVDLLVRTSGEIRLSDFLLWQGSYSCLLFWDVLWPEFSPLHLYASIFVYQRHRRQQERRRKDDPLSLHRGEYLDQSQRRRVETFLKRIDEDHLEWEGKSRLT